MKSLATDLTLRWRIAQSTRSSSDRDGSVLLDTEKGVFYGANATGSKIWELIRQSPDGVTIDSLLNQMTADVEVSREQLARDLDDYLQDLATRGLVTKETSR